MESVPPPPRASSRMPPPPPPGMSAGMRMPGDRPFPPGRPPYPPSRFYHHSDIPLNAPSFGNNRPPPQRSNPFAPGSHPQPPGVPPPPRLQTPPPGVEVVLPASTSIDTSKKAKFRWSRLDKFSRFEVVGACLRPFLLALVVMMTALLAFGCLSESVNGVHVLAIGYGEAASVETSDENSNILPGTMDMSTGARDLLQEVRVGYFGLCARTVSNGWICNRSAPYVVSRLKDSGVADTLNLLWLADTFQSEAISPILVLLTLAVSCICLLWVIASMVSTKFGLFRSKKGPMPRIRKYLARHSSGVFGVFYSFIAICAFNVAFWQQQAVAIMITTTKGMAPHVVSLHGGSSALALGWLAFVVALVGLIVQALSRRTFMNMDSDRGSGSVASSSRIVDDEDWNGDRTQRQTGGPQGRSQQNFSSGPPPIARAAMDYMTGHQWARERVPMTEKRRQTNNWVRGRRLPPQGFVEGEVTDDSSSSGARTDRVV